MTENRKPGDNSKVTNVPYIFQLETWAVSHKYFTDFLKF